MYIKCNTNVNYLFQKTTRASTQGISLYRNQQSQICLAIGKEGKKGVTSFKLEESLSKIYSDYVSDGKCTIELKLAGGSCTNILISKANPDELLNFLSILNIIMITPERSFEIDLGNQSNEEEEEE
ncbi:hypothetical protein DICPUDRAFT_157047 [Dictyostelium purpureum]|uniref:PIF1/LRR1 pleckstrin homology domain-containing protein n=1 Tax=Dictyostelium purpureum TaxID=5786 RepID=F0ZY49_DICPU|nr:uncharacterized protein DICPUDRAFT_157047 [Dictyostelium purpureum]EGC31132.1 hypothetical protein DICPUDRAFT_157047 [Dictyostelium purpureum]|eukprot:XP_003292350.1 hypothetical protein DICPUDRAFT_157047 [Dictyostelium purpureum]